MKRITGFHFDQNSPLNQQIVSVVANANALVNHLEEAFSAATLSAQWQLDNERMSVDGLEIAELEPILALEKRANDLTRELSFQ